MNKVINYALGLLSATVLLSSCADPKKDLIDQHYKLYTEYLADANYLAKTNVLTPKSKALLGAAQDLSLDQAKAIGKEYNLSNLLLAYYHAVEKDGKAAVPLLDYVSTMPKHPLSYQNTRLVIPDKTEVAPTPFVAVYYEGGGRKVLEWLKYDRPESSYQLDLLFVLRQLEKRLAKEVKDAKKDYAKLDVDSYLRNRYDKTTAQAVATEINRLRPMRLKELGTGMAE